MPEKDGADDKKTTKSVVNKKQKQMMGEEGYDIARDMGRVKPSKDKKDGTSYPPSAEMKKTQKVNKGPSSFERVKKKYGKSVMNVKKEELDLTQVAESFGGHIVEFVDTAARKALEKTFQKSVEKTGQKAGQQAANKIVSTGRTFKGFQDKVKPVTPEIVKPIPKNNIRPVDSKELAKIKPKTSTLVKGNVKQDAITTATDTAMNKISNKRPPTTGEKQPTQQDKPSKGFNVSMPPKLQGGKASFVMARG